jgi:hypothetical protein
MCQLIKLTPKVKECHATQLCGNLCMAMCLIRHGGALPADEEPIGEPSTSYAPLSRGHYGSANFGSTSYGSGTFATDADGSYSPMSAADPNSPFHRDRNYKSVLMTPPSVGRTSSGSLAGNAENSAASTPKAGSTPRRLGLVEVRSRGLSGLVLLVSVVCRMHADMLVTCRCLHLSCPLAPTHLILHPCSTAQCPILAPTKRLMTPCTRRTCATGERQLWLQRQQQQQQQRGSRARLPGQCLVCPSWATWPASQAGPLLAACLPGSTTSLTASAGPTA